MADECDAARDERQASDGQDQLDGAASLLLLHLPPLFVGRECDELAPLKLEVFHGGVVELLRPGFRLTLLSRNHGGFYMVGRPGLQLPGPGVRVGGAANIAMVLFGTGAYTFHLKLRFIKLIYEHSKKEEIKKFDNFPKKIQRLK